MQRRSLKPQHSEYQVFSNLRGIHLFSSFGFALINQTTIKQRIRRVQIFIEVTRPYYIVFAFSIPFGKARSMDALISASEASVALIAISTEPYLLMAFLIMSFTVRL
jgi:hypothetical protein